MKFVVRPPHKTTTYVTLFWKRNWLVLPGLAAFQSELATLAIGLPASSPKLKQALNKPEIIERVRPNPNLYSVAFPPGPPCAEGGASAVMATSSKTAV